MFYYVIVESGVVGSKGGKGGTILVLEGGGRIVIRMPESN